MSLTKEEIQFIERYLKKNEVKFWDVRLELLDHIVSAVEDKMQNQETSFNEALLDVHLGFGNQFIPFGIPKKDWFKKGLYQSNIGFKKFIMQKQKEIRRQQRKRYWKTFLPYVFSLRFLIEITLFITLIAIIWQYMGYKTTFMTFGFCTTAIEFSKFLYGGFKKFKNKSLNIQLAFLFSLFYIQTLYWAQTIFNWYYDNILEKPYSLLFLIYFGVLIFSRHSLNTYKNTYITYKNRYKLYTS